MKRRSCEFTHISSGLLLHARDAHVAIVISRSTLKSKDGLRCDFCPSHPGCCFMLTANGLQDFQVSGMDVTPTA